MVVKTILFKCHDLVAIWSLVCNNNVSPMRNHLSPWCKCHEKYIHMVRNEIKIQYGDAIHSVCKFYEMSPNFVPSKLYRFIWSLHLCLYPSITFLILLCFKTLGVESFFGTKQRMRRKYGWVLILSRSVPWIEQMVKRCMLS